MLLGRSFAMSFLLRSSIEGVEEPNHLSFIQRVSIDITFRPFCQSSCKCLSFSWKSAVVAKARETLTRQVEKEIRGISWHWTGNGFSSWAPRPTLPGRAQSLELHSESQHRYHISSFLPELLQVFEFQLKISCCGKGPGNLDQAGGKRDVYSIHRYLNVYIYIYNIYIYMYKYIILVTYTTFTPPPESSRPPEPWSSRPKFSRCGCFQK